MWPYDGDRAVAVLHPHPHAEAAGRAGADDDARHRDVDGGADRGGDVDALVDRAPATAEAGRDGAGQDPDGAARGAARRARERRARQRGNAGRRTHGARSGGSGGRTAARCGDCARPGLGGRLLQVGRLDQRGGVGDGGLGHDGRRPWPAAEPATALLKLARAAAMPSSTAGSAVVRACWAAAASVPPTTTAATACIGVGKTDGSALDRWAPPDPAAAARADSGGPWYARRPLGERCRDTTFPSWIPPDLARTRRPGLSAGPLGERGPCPVCDRVVIDPRTTLAALRRRVESPTAPLRPPGVEERQADAACRPGHAAVTATIRRCHPAPPPPFVAR